LRWPSPIENLKDSGIGAALVDSPFVRQTVLSNCFLEKAQSGLLVTVSGEQEVNVEKGVENFPLPRAIFPVN